MRVLFVRHGESMGNRMRQLQGWLDLPLTERGLEQARRIAAVLAVARPVSAVYTSSLMRAAATAAVIGRSLGVAPEPDPDLRECDVGDATGLTWEEFAQRFPGWAARIEASSEGQDLDELWPNGERSSQFRERCRRALARIGARHPSDTVVVVAHGGTIVWGLTCLLDPESTRWPGYDIPTASISEVLVEGGRARLIRLGDVLHLA